MPAAIGSVLATILTATAGCGTADSPLTAILQHILILVLLARQHRLAMTTFCVASSTYSSAASSSSSPPTHQRRPFPAIGCFIARARHGQDLLRPGPPSQPADGLSPPASTPHRLSSGIVAATASFLPLLFFHLRFIFSALLLHYFFVFIISFYILLCCYYYYIWLFTAILFILFFHHYFILLFHFIASYNL
jgi:hypothetical protein